MYRMVSSGGLRNDGGAAHWHTFQLLTKRPERLAAMATPTSVGPTMCGWAFQVENQHWTCRIDDLRRLPRVSSCLWNRFSDPCSLDLADIDWVIVGGESGHGARPWRPTGPAASATNARCKCAVLLQAVGEACWVQGSERGRGRLRRADSRIVKLGTQSRS